MATRQSYSGDDIDIQEIYLVMCYTLIDIQLPGNGEVFAVIKVDADSPWFDGHFPDDPTLPGIGQLGMVADALGHLLGEEYSVSGLSRVKFRKRIGSGEILYIHAVAGKKEKSYAFRLTDGDDALVSSGVMQFAKK